MDVFLGRLVGALAGVCVTVAATSADAAPDCQGAPSAAKLIIEVEGVRNARGFVVGNLYGPVHSRFLADNGWITVWREPARPSVTSICTFLPAPGAYEVVVFHDANANGDLDQGPFGIPLEGYGFSNNVRPFLRPPSLAAARFNAAAGDTILRIRLHYP